MKLLIFFALALSTASGFGIHNSKLGITKGKKAADGEFPYQVGLSFLLLNKKEKWCGGSLIGNEWVLTAAHCTYRAVSVTVFLGATERTKAEIKYNVDLNDIIDHDDWDNRSNKNDIALIKIPCTGYTNKIKSVKLPTISKSYSTYIGIEAVASGWGFTSDSVKSLSNDLQWAHLEVIKNKECVKVYDIEITANHICVATTGGVSTCDGDSGGPLVVETDLIQIGVTSVGAEESCTKGNPEAFTRVTSYLDWIKEKTGIYY